MGFIYSRFPSTDYASVLVDDVGSSRSLNQRTEPGRRYYDGMAGHPVGYYCSRLGLFPIFCFSINRAVSVP